MPSPVKSHRAFKVVEAIHDAHHYAFFRVSRRDKSFTCSSFRFMIGRASDPTGSGGTMRVRAFIAAAAIAALAGPALGPALAQTQAPVQRYGEKDKEKSQTELQAEKDAQRAYKRSLDSVPEKGPVDPWGNARTVEAPKAAAKTAAPAKPKTGEAAK
jgi:hypothetical protein